MRKTAQLRLSLLILVACAGPETITNSNGNVQTDSTDKVQIMLLGTFHFNQFHNAGNPASNFFSEQRQQEIAEVNQALKAFAPDMIMIEREPKTQATHDSLYQLYLNGELNPEEVENGAGEVYQLAFKLAKSLGQEKLHCVDYNESTSQGLLSSGDNIEVFQNGLQHFQQTTRGATSKFMEGQTTFMEFLYFMNKPEIVQLSHQQFYNLPAYVQNGSFKSYEGLNRSTIDTTQIGAEFIALFYERNLKIYSNILNAQVKHKGKRILLIMGQTHIGVLQNIIKNNPNYEIVSTNLYLKEKEV